MAADPRPDDDMDFINHWMRIGREARSRTLLRLPHGSLDELARLCEQESVKQSLANLMTFPWIHERLVSGSSDLHGWYFDIGEAQLQRYDRVSDRLRGYQRARLNPLLEPGTVHPPKCYHLLSQRRDQHDCGVEVAFGARRNQEEAGKAQEEARPKWQGPQGKSH